MDARAAATFGGRYDGEERDSVPCFQGSGMGLSPSRNDMNRFEVSAPFVQFKCWKDSDELAAFKESHAAYARE
eukprot:6038047-Amphidinium_carterae.1